MFLNIKLTSQAMVFKNGIRINMLNFTCYYKCNNIYFIGKQYNNK